MRWFKFYGQDYLSDPKMLALSPSERSCWITLLCYASVNDNGMITFLSEQQLMMQAGLDFQFEDWDKTVGILEKLKNLDMITIDNGVITVKNWHKRQDSNLTSYERVKRFREKNKEKKQPDNTKITLEENRIDKKRIINKDIAVPSEPLKEFSLKEEIKKLEDSERRDLNVIALYFEERMPDLKTKDQFNVALRRHLRAAKELKDFSDDQIIKGMEKAKKQTPEWTIETIIKMLTK